MKLVREGINESFSKVENKLNSLGIGIIKIIKDWMFKNEFSDDDYTITNDNIIHISIFVSMRKMEAEFKNRPDYIQVKFDRKICELMLYLVEDNFESFSYMASTIDFRTISCNTPIISYIKEYGLKKYGNVLLSNKTFVKQCKRFIGFHGLEILCEKNNT